MLTIALISLTNSCTQKSSDINSATNTTAGNFQLGKTIFEERCSKCHRITQKDGSQFDRIFERMPEPAEEYFIRFVQDSKTLKRSGDGYANAVDSTYNSEYEHLFKDSLSTEDFQNIIVYLVQRTNESKHMRE